MNGSDGGQRQLWDQVLSAPNSSPKGRSQKQTSRNLFQRRDRTSQSNKSRSSPYTTNDNTSSKPQSSISKSSRQTPNSSHKQTDCTFCLDSDKCLKYRENTFIAASNHVYLAAQLIKDALVPYHMFICPVNHISTSCQFSYEAQNDVRKFKKSITSFLQDLSSPVFAECGYEHGSFKPVFVEWNLWSKSGWMRSAFQAAGSGPHVTIDVLPLSKDDHADAMKIIARELQAIGSDLTRKNKGLRRIKSDVPISSLMNVNEPPKYIYIDFGEESFLLTLEDDDRDDLNLTEKIDRKFMRSLLKSLYPDDIVSIASSGLNETNYYLSMRNQFTKYDFNV